MQHAKIIDITRSFVPINPNSFPETLHSTQKEDHPERIAPVIPYMGANFLPTSYGYKSYFGIENHLDIESLAPNKVDHLFIFQTLEYVNILIALCDTGIWTKDGSTVGPWTQLIAIDPVSEALYFEWTFTTIKNDLYVFRSNGTAYYKIETDDSADGILVTTVVPTFITITAQLGLCRFGGRLGFWDAENAIACSSSDDLQEFTPAVLTGANVTTFTSMLGRISCIRAHGKHAIAYASRSIILLQVEPGETFLLRASPILNSVGVPYAKQSCVSNPDTTHFAYTDSGIYRIENAKAELIVPEVFDYFKEYTPTPIYLQVLEGRYLCFETTDLNAISGNAIFTREVIPPVSLVLPGDAGSIDEIHALDPVDADFCDISAQLSDGDVDEQTAAGNDAVPADLRKPGTSVTPIYTCYISNNGVKDVSNLTWDSSPCGTVGPKGTPWHMSPAGETGELASFTSDSTNKRQSYGPDAWIDGKWTIQRFVQTQMAIWKAEQAARDAFMAAIKNRAFAESSTAESAVCVVQPTTPSQCEVGIWPTEFSEPQFGFNQCSFWLTRYAISAEKITSRFTSSTSCAPSQVTLEIAGYRKMQNGNIIAEPLYASGEAAAAAFNYYSGDYTGRVSSVGAIGAVRNGNQYTSTSMTHVTLDSNGNTVATPGGGNGAVAVWNVINPSDVYAVTAGNADGTTFTPPLIKSTAFSKTSGGSAYNEGADYPIPPTPESPYCTLTHWKYTDKNGVVQYKPATACDTTSDRYPGSNTPTRVVPQNAQQFPPINDADGSFCSNDFEVPDGTENWDIAWPDETVTYPGGNFLLQLGSIAPRYPTFEGFFVYDLHLKKWGKMKGQYKQLLNYSPMNSASAATLNFTTFGIVAGLIKADGFVYLFDNDPVDSYLTWGKIGYYRAGMTDPEEVRMDFKTLSTGALRVDTSLDGTSLGTELTTTESFTSTRQVVCYPEYSGKWHNITVTGKYDVSHLQFKGLQKGRR